MKPIFRFVFSWLLASVVAALLSQLVTSWLYYPNSVVVALNLAIAGAIVGLLQWLVLRTVLPNSIPWVRNTVVAWGLFGLVFVGLGLPLEGLLFAGLLVGVAQWLLLKEETDGAALWIIASGINGMLLASLSTNYSSLAIAALLGATLTGYSLVRLFGSTISTEGLPTNVGLVALVLSTALLIALPGALSSEEMDSSGWETSLLLSDDHILVEAPTVQQGTDSAALEGIDLAFGCGDKYTAALVPDGPLGSGYFPFVGIWTSACNEHDRCYETLGASRRACDNELEDDMISTCKNVYGLYINKIKYFGSFFDFIAKIIRTPNPLYWDCHGEAKLVGAFVKRVGGPAFERAQKQALNSSVYRLHYRNKCNQTIQTAVHFKNLDGEWVTDGWWTIQPGEEAFVARTRNTYYYIYAETTSSQNRQVWSGDKFNYTIRNSSQTYGFIQKKIVMNGWGDYYQGFTCRN